jgi:hypothetical protein
MYSWNVDWPLTLWPTAIALFVFVVAVSGGYLLQRAQVATYADTKRSTWSRVLTLAALRLCVLLILFWMLAGTSYTKLIPTSGDIWFVVDRSASMRQSDESNESDQPQSRIHRSLDVLESLQSAWAEKATNSQFKVFSIGSELAQTDIDSLRDLIRDPNADELDPVSRLGNSLDELMQKAVVDQPQAIVVMTDGRVTDGIALSSVAPTRSGAPNQMFVLATGQYHADPFLEIVDVNQPSIVFVGDKVQLKVQLHARDLTGSTVEVALQDSKSGKTAASATKSISDNNSIVTLDLSLQATDAGVQQYELNAIASAADKADSAIAQRAFALHVRETPLPILVVADGFSYEVRFLRHFLERTRRQGSQNEPIFAPTFCIREAERRFVRADSSMVAYLPAEQNWWNQFEACVFVDPAPQLIDATLANTIQKTVVDQGMGLIFVAGRSNSLTSMESSLWKRLLPINNWTIGDHSAMNVRFTDQARNFGVNLNDELAKYQNINLPRIASMGASFRPSVSASVLASDTRAPFLLTHFIGAGQVYFQSTDETYRWRSIGGTDTVFNTYWTELLASSAKSNRLAAGLPTLVVESVQDHSYSGQNIDLRMDSSGVGVDIGGDVSAIPLLMESADRTESIAATLIRSSDVNVFRTSVMATKAGHYSIRADRDRSPDFKLNLTGTIAVDPPLSESIDRGPDMDELKNFASKCSGVLLPVKQWQMIVNQLTPQKVLHFEPMPPKSIWNYPLLVALVIGILGAEWFLRNRWGLI